MSTTSSSATTTLYVNGKPAWDCFAKKMFDWGAALQVVFGAITGHPLPMPRALAPATRRPRRTRWGLV